MNEEDKKSSLITDLFTYDKLVLYGKVAAISSIVVIGGFFAYDCYQKRKSDYKKIMKYTSAKYKDMDYD
jgi:hypothetical protein